MCKSNIFVLLPSESMKAQALQTAQEAVRAQQSVLHKFSDSTSGGVTTQPGEKEYAQPVVFMGQLKSYQLKGMNWIANLYYFVSSHHLMALNSSVFLMFSLY